jgi:hypothetical protein
MAAYVRAVSASQAIIISRSVDIEPQHTTFTFQLIVFFADEFFVIKWHHLAFKRGLRERSLSLGKAREKYSVYNLTAGGRMLILLIVLVVGLILYLPEKMPPKIARVGEIMFFCALLVLCFSVANVHILGKY